MRIAMVSEYIGDALGFGQERVVRDATALLRDSGHEVLHLAAHSHGAVSDGPLLLPELFTNNVLTPPTKARHAQNVALRWLREKKPDVVLLHDAPDAGFLRRCAREFPTVLSVHTVAATCPASGRFAPAGA